MVIVLMNMFVSVLNESYTDAKTQAEESVEEREMACLERDLNSSYIAMI